MARKSGGEHGLRPERFNAIQTPPISPVEVGSANDGLPSYAKLDVLVAYLTSPTTLNYDTLSDFLMTYKLYATEEEVWYLLASRLLWAANTAARNGTESETGRDIGTRTFVLLRQWMRDYFATDFVPNLSLREHVAETLTTLSGCTEFVLVDYFQKILSQLRREWDTQISRFWVLPSNVAGNIDTPVPVGGDALEVEELNRLAAPGTRSGGIVNTRPSPILNGEIPIDADIAVPSIQSSPQRRKPRARLSTLFKKTDESDNGKFEAVLHGKVDLLAMQLINEYHLFERRNASATPSSELQEYSFYQPLQQDVSQASRTTDFSTELHSDSHHDIVESEQDEDRSIPSPSTPTKPRTRTASASSKRESSSSSFREEFSTPTPSLYDEDVWATPRRSPSHVWVLPLNDTESFKRQQRHSSKRAASASAGAGSRSTTGSAAGSNRSSVTELADCSHKTGIENEAQDDEDKYHNDEDSDDNGIIGSRRLRDRSDNSIATNNGRAMVHEHSVDTLNMHIALANTSCDSEIELDLDTMDPSVPTAENWGTVDYDQFDQVSYSGSSLSTLSTSTHSAFSAHIGNASGYGGSRRSFDSDRSISLLSEIENSILQPCPGYTSGDAARLKAIPDNHLDGDVLLTTLQKLEGIIPNIRPEDIPVSLHTLHVTNGSSRMGIPRSSTIELYSQALGSSDTDTTTTTATNGNTGGTSVSLQDGKVTKQLTSSSPRGTNTLEHEVSQLGIASNSKSSPTSRHNMFESIVAQETGQHSSMNQEDEIELERQQLSDPGFQPDIPEPLQPTLHIGLPSATHAPFVLSFTARAIAEQMTYIEREIASQIDISSLVRMELPKRDYPAVRKIISWLQVVMEEPQIKSTALVTARFDIVRQWVQSEILLCPSPALQAQAMSRFVHIAFESLRLQNFATMVQLVHGLCSPEVQSQLGDDVFRLVPPHDRETLERLESLASPNQNYSKLRKAHNRFSWSKGCVPFTAMFLSDIELNAEAASQNAEHEIHFGKYRVASQVVRELQRCIESAQNYKINPEPALLSKCLYLTSIPNL